MPSRIILFIRIIIVVAQLPLLLLGFPLPILSIPLLLLLRVLSLFLVGPLSLIRMLLLTWINILERVLFRSLSLLQVQVLLFLRLHYHVLRYIRAIVLLILLTTIIIALNHWLLLLANLNRGFLLWICSVLTRDYLTSSYCFLAPISEFREPHATTPCCGSPSTNRDYWKWCGFLTTPFFYPRWAFGEILL